MELKPILELSVSYEFVADDESLVILESILYASMNLL